MRTRIIGKRWYDGVKHDFGHFSDTLGGAGRSKYDLPIGCPECFAIALAYTSTPSVEWCLKCAPMELPALEFVNQFDGVRITIDDVLRGNPEYDGFKQRGGVIGFSYIEGVGGVTPIEIPEVPPLCPQTRWARISVWERNRLALPAVAFNALSSEALPAWRNVDTGAMITTDEMLNRYMAQWCKDDPGEAEGGFVRASFWVRNIEDSIWLDKENT